MRTLGRRLSDAVIFGLIVVLLAPAVVRAAHQLVVPVLGAVAVVVLLRLLWFWTSL